MNREKVDPYTRQVAKFFCRLVPRTDLMLTNLIKALDGIAREESNDLSIFDEWSDPYKAERLEYLAAMGVRTYYSKTAIERACKYCVAQKASGGPAATLREVMSQHRDLIEIFIRWPFA